MRDFCYVLLSILDLESVVFLYRVVVISSDRGVLKLVIRLSAVMALICRTVMML